jgi:hypothetical protein
MQINAGQNLSVLDQLALRQGQPQQQGLPLQQQQAVPQGFSFTPQQRQSLDAVNQFRLDSSRLDPNAQFVFLPRTPGGLSALEEISIGNAIPNLVNLSNFASGNLLQGLGNVGGGLSNDNIVNTNLASVAAVGRDPLVIMAKQAAGLGQGFSTAQQAQMGIRGALSPLTNANPLANLSSFALGGNSTLAIQIQRESILKQTGIPLALDKQLKAQGIDIIAVLQARPDALQAIQAGQNPQTVIETLLGRPLAGAVAAPAGAANPLAALGPLLQALGGGAAPAGAADPLAALAPLLASLGGAGAAAPQVAASRQVQANAPQANVAPAEDPMAMILMLVMALTMQGQSK